MRAREFMREGKGEAMLAKVDMLLQNTGFARKGFEIVKAPQQGSIRGSITDEALDAIKATLAKAKAMGATEPAKVKPIMNPADVDDSEFKVETATAGATVSGNIATVANPVHAKQKVTKKGKYGAPQAPQKKNKDGTTVNALDDTTSFFGAPIKRQN